MRKLAAPIAAGLILMIATPALIFWYNEARREQLIAKYEVSPNFLEFILKKKKGEMSLIMEKDEVLVCAISGYGNVDKLSQLNSPQKSSIPKDKLPSEDLAWYLLFFTKDSASRVYLIDSEKIEGAYDSGGAGCVSREGQFSILSVRDENGSLRNTLTLSKGRRQ